VSLGLVVVDRHREEPTGVTFGGRGIVSEWGRFQDLIHDEFDRQGVKGVDVNAVIEAIVNVRDFFPGLLCAEATSGGVATEGLRRALADIAREWDGAVPLMRGVDSALKDAIERGRILSMVGEVREAHAGSRSASPAALSTTPPAPEGDREGLVSFDLIDSALLAFTSDPPNPVAGANILRALRARLADPCRDPEHAQPCQVEGGYHTFVPVDDREPGS
jgi:hypothetical protein